MEAAPIVLGERADPAIACTLPAGEITGRTDDWRHLLGSVVDREALPTGETGIRLVLDSDAPLDELIRMAVAEQGCCAFFSFAITVDGRGLALEIRVPADAEDVVVATFGTAS